MNRIILAYAAENANLAVSIDRQLSRIGIPFEHASGAVAAHLTAADEPVLLLITDNFLINRACMGDLLPVLQRLAAENRLLVVLADGINATGQPVPTKIDRMANALHYMKHWQDEWLALSDQHQKAQGSEKASLVAEMDATRGLANEVGDLIGTLREAGYITWDQFEANDFEQFFQKFQLMDWHVKYKHLVAQAVEDHSIMESAKLLEMSLPGGLLTPEPFHEPEEFPAVDMPSEPTLEAMDAFLGEMENEEPVSVSEFSSKEDEDSAEAEDQAARDAWFWIENGHLQRGLELFQIALEQYPKSEWLKGEYERAVHHTNPPMAEPGIAQPMAPETSISTDEVRSYELMGDMAADRGDYLFAKYCWDRVVEIDPGIPNIYRKLGLMTYEHLRDYRETAIIYLRKALDFNPNDPEVKAALGEMTSPTLPEQEVGEQGGIAVDGSSNIEEAKAQKDQPPTILKEPSRLVLITGATSGIGKATAEIFARNGYRLILTGRRIERLVDLKNRFESEFETEILVLPFDVRDQRAVEAALANLPESFREIDILVNNAGLAKGLSPIHEGNLDHWETMIDTNVKGLLYVTRVVAPGMVLRRQGHIINIGSSASKEAYPNGNVYCATKFAVEALTRSMRFDLHAHNIRVSQVSPGHVEETEFAITRFDGDAERAKIYNDFQPLKSSDVAEAIYFMATRPPHVNIQDIQLFATQQASSMVVNRSGR
jgi:NADP-dependent 3-hydroxy acid dehydrogenase YdfG